jgi:hypothetical protein
VNVAAKTSKIAGASQARGSVHEAGRRSIRSKRYCVSSGGPKKRVLPSGPGRPRRNIATSSALSAGSAVQPARVAWCSRICPSDTVKSQP